MAWITRIRECRMVDAFLPQEKERQGDVGRNPGVVRMRRVCMLIHKSSIARTIGRERRLPEHRGAGPCGTLARCSTAGAMAWSVTHLVGPLVDYYATYVPPRFVLGASQRPRGRKRAA